jgi:hypothetical protein
MNAPIYPNVVKDAALLGICLHGVGAIAASGVARCRRDDHGDEMVSKCVHGWIGTESITGETDADHDLVQCYAGRSHKLPGTMAEDVQRGTNGLPVKEPSSKAEPRIGQPWRQSRELTETGEFIVAKQGARLRRMAAL